MKKLMMVVCAGTLTIFSCTREKTTTEKTETETVATTTNDADYEAEYRKRADKISARMASDMKFDPTTQDKVKQVYYTRAQRLAELRRKYYSNTNASGGMSPDTTGMYTEMQAIYSEADNEFRSFLNPQQITIYDTNRSNYWSDMEAGWGSDSEVATETETDMALDSSDTSRSVEVDDDETKVEMDGVKVKAEPGKSKVETATYESKIKGNESKYKTKDGDVKIKKEPGKTKIETKDSKIKIKEKD